MEKAIIRRQYNVSDKKWTNHKIIGSLEDLQAMFKHELELGHNGSKKVKLENKTVKGLVRSLNNSFEYWSSPGNGMLMYEVGTIEPSDYDNEPLMFD